MLKVKTNNSTILVLLVLKIAMFHLYRWLLLARPILPTFYREKSKCMDYRY